MGTGSTVGRIGGMIAPFMKNLVNFLFLCTCLILLYFRLVFSFVSVCLPLCLFVTSFLSSFLFPFIGMSVFLLLYSGLLLCPEHSYEIDIYFACVQTLNVYHQ